MLKTLFATTILISALPWRRWPPWRIPRRRLRPPNPRRWSTTIIMVIGIIIITITTITTIIITAITATTDLA